MIRTGWQRTWVRCLTTVLTIAVMGMIFCFSMQDADRSDRTSGVLSQVILWVMYPEEDAASMRQEQYGSVQFAVRKTAHFSEYLLLGFLLRLCAESWIGHRVKNVRFPAAAALAAGALYAGSDEIHQLAVSGRSGQWADVLVDCCGVLAGTALGSLLIRKTKKRPDGTA